MGKLQKFAEFPEKSADYKTKWAMYEMLEDNHKCGEHYHWNIDYQ